MKEIEVIMCPHCGEMWRTSDPDIKSKQCKCFRCWKDYIPQRIYNMWDFVFTCVKNCRGK